MKTVRIGNIEIGESRPLLIIAGPCVIENEKITLKTAEKILKITKKSNLPFIFKSSYEKANRTAVENYRGPGLKEGLGILKKVKKELGVPVLSDVHCRTEVREAAEILDVLQIPAYLCQQTPLALEVANTGKPVNLKKGQFLAPWDMAKVAAKISGAGNNNILLTERGTVFGYNNLVVDFRSFIIMKNIGYPVIFDVTHAVRVPGHSSNEPSSGQQDFIRPLARAAVAAGCHGLFLEVHPEPVRALCDSYSMLSLENLPLLLSEVIAVREAINGTKKR